MRVRVRETENLSTEKIMKKILLFLMIIFMSVSVLAEKIIIQKAHQSPVVFDVTVFSLMESGYSYTLKYDFHKVPHIGTLENILFIIKGDEIIYVNPDLYMKHQINRDIQIKTMVNSISQFSKDFHTLYLIQIGTMALALLLILLA